MPPRAGIIGCPRVCPYKSSRMMHGEIKMLVLHAPENASVIPWCEARTAVFHPEILQSVVRRLRTTHRKLSPSDSAVCAFAPLEKRPRSVGP